MEKRLRQNKPVIVLSWSSKALWSCLWCRSFSCDPGPFSLLLSGPFSIPCCSQHISEPSVAEICSEVQKSSSFYLLAPGLQIDYTSLIFTSKVYPTPNTVSHHYTAPASPPPHAAGDVYHHADCWNVVILSLSEWGRTFFFFYLPQLYLIYFPHLVMHIWIIGIWRIPHALVFCLWFVAFNRQQYIQCPLVEFFYLFIDFKWDLTVW